MNECCCLKKKLQFFFLDSTFPKRQLKQPIIYAILAIYFLRNCFGSAVIDAMWQDQRNKFRCGYWFRQTKLKSHGTLMKAIVLM